MKRCDATKFFCLQVLDYAEFGNIQEAMPKLSVFSLIQMVTQLASALEYLDSKNLIHLRMNISSIFVTKPGKVRTTCIDRSHYKLKKSACEFGAKMYNDACLLFNIPCT